MIDLTFGNFTKIWYSFVHITLAILNPSSASAKVSRRKILEFQHPRK